MTEPVGKRKTAHKSAQAPGQFYGYSVQITRMLAHLLRCRAGAAVSLEVLDDVAVVDSDGTTAEQSKSGLAHNPVSDRSTDLWKTLSNWVSAIRAGALGSDTRFVLYVAQPYKGTLVQELHDVSTRPDAVTLIRRLRNDFWGDGPEYSKRAALPEGLAPFVNGVLEASDEVLAHLIQGFAFEAGSGSPNDDLRPALREKAISDTSVDNVLQYLLGWVKQTVDKMIEQGKAAVITWNEFNKKLVAAARKFDRSDHLVSADTTHTQSDIDREIKNRVYVRQLELIQSEDRDLTRAVSDYLRASADRTSWSERGDVLEPSFRSFEEDLQRHWSTRRQLVQVELVGRSDLDLGRAVFARCMDVQQRLQGMDVPSHFTPGSYHALADSLTLGWHPRFEALLVRAPGASDDAGDGGAE